MVPWLLAASAAAWSSAAQAAVVRDVARPATRSSETRVVAVVEGDCRVEARAGAPGEMVFEIAPATLASDAPRFVPVADARIDGVIVREDKARGSVRLVVDLAASEAPPFDILRDDASGTVVLRFGGERRAGVATAAVNEAAPSARRGLDERERKARRDALERIRRLPASSASGKAAAPEARSRPVDAAASSTTAKSPAAATASPRATTAPTATASAPAKARASIPVPARAMVVLDPGHGGRDPGARSWTGEDEKDIVLDIATRVARRLREEGSVDVVMTRTGDEYVALADRRAASGRWGADVFVSIHANASGKSVTRGIETYFHPRAAASGREKRDPDVKKLAREENGGRRSRQGQEPRLARTSVAAHRAPAVDRHAESERLAHAVQGQLVRSLGMRYDTVRDLGIKEGPFFVIRENPAPSVLVEAAFLTHREEGVRMQSQVYREQIAEGVARGILAYLAAERRGDGL